jgi:hypothetical protein
MMPMKMNSFDRERMQWEHQEFNTKKLSNLNNCPLIIGCSIGTGEPSIMAKNSSNGAAEIQGIEKDIWMEFSRQFNFQPVFEVHGQFPGLLDENGTATG